MRGAGGAQAKDVADALREMIGRLGPLFATRTAVVMSSGIAKLQARRIADVDAEVFTSMVLARDRVLRAAATAPASPPVDDEPSDARAEGLTVHVHGPSDVDVTMTPAAALETARRIGDAAAEVLLAVNAGQPEPRRRAA